MGDRILLVVEDDPDDQALILRALKEYQEKGQIVMLRDGVEALEYLFGTGAQAGRQAGQELVAVILDLKMPRLDGIEVLKRMRADVRTKFLPAVILTSSNEPQDIFRSFSSGANSFVRKPVEFARFIDTVRELGTYWLLRNESPPPQERDAGPS